MRWVVLSDLHLSFENCTTSTARKSLLSTLQKESQEHGNCSFILLTGDFMNMHSLDIEKEAEYIKQLPQLVVFLHKIYLCVQETTILIEITI